jgi:uncharacterized protein (DUF305 family)
MNTNTILVAVLALIVGLGGGYALAANRTVPMQHDMNSVMSGMTEQLKGAEGAEFERAFIDGMIVHHAGAVAMAQMVLQKSERPELVQLANEIISAQTREIDMMREWSAQWFGAQSPVNSVEMGGETHNSDHQI